MGRPLREFAFFFLWFAFNNFIWLWWATCTDIYFFIAGFYFEGYFFGFFGIFDILATIHFFFFLYIIEIFRIYRMVYVFRNSIIQNCYASWQNCSKNLKKNLATSHLHCSLVIEWFVEITLLRVVFIFLVFLLMRQQIL